MLKHLHTYLWVFGSDTEAQQYKPTDTCISRSWTLHIIVGLEGEMTCGVFIVAKQNLAKPCKRTLMLLSTSTVTQSVCMPGLQRSAQNLKTKDTHAPTATSWCIKSCAKDMMWLRCWGRNLSWTSCTELQLSETRRLRDSAS